MGQSSKQDKPPVGGGLFAAALIYVGVGELARVVRTGQITWVQRSGPNVLITHVDHPAAFDFMLILAIGSTLFGLLILCVICYQAMKRWRSKSLQCML
jgi:hypothetical protein